MLKNHHQLDILYHFIMFIPLFLLGGSSIFPLSRNMNILMMDIIWMDVICNLPNMNIALLQLAGDPSVN
jgi:hypothetical protein